MADPQVVPSPRRYKSPWFPGPGVYRTQPSSAILLLQTAPSHIDSASFYQGISQVARPKTAARRSYFQRTSPCAHRIRCAVWVGSFRCRDWVKVRGFQSLQARRPIIRNRSRPATRGPTSEGLRGDDD
ncbi:hypothetical protein VP01_979g6 [Puccinia sorghi]|uniref:Uncharacterized protein n=1 Tax=Puccinia sorghi TaxID=27349 RepID=A0A0L6U5S0_9BASI|nr:hypothetical protein VP01_979g6 [Puccinia sorghi]